MRSERGWKSRPLVLAFFLLASRLSPLTSQAIQDNSFLLEEAYNQEAGIVQHISSLSRYPGGAWAYSFTQEWPLGGIRHQLGYTISILHADPNGTGLGDIALNYRYQLAGNPEARTLVAPRISVLLPTGNERMDRGSGGLGFQGNLPVTLVLNSQWVTHWNAGAALTPSARNRSGARATTADFNLGASVIWLLQPSLNLLVEALWLSEQSVEGAGLTAREDRLLISPGVRVAFNLSGGLQIVPGAAYTIAVAPKDAEDALLLYLSFEHPFKRQ